MSNRSTGRVESIALHLPTDHRYLVQMVNQEEGLVYCWGEVEGFTALRTYHGESLLFPLDECRVTPCHKTPDLVSGLAIQRCRVEGRTFWFTSSGNMKVSEPSPAYHRAIESARAYDKVYGKLMDILADRRGEH